MTFEPLLGNILESGRLDRRCLEGGLALLDALDGLARSLARLVDAQDIAGSDGGPHLFAMWIEGDRDERFRTRRLDADVVAAQLGIGVSVAFGVWFEGGDALVGEGLAHVTGIPSG